MEEMSKELKGVISQMLKPLKGLPLSVVIEGLSGYKVKPFNKRSDKDLKVLEILKNVADNVLTTVNKKGILRQRPNEVGNDIEPYVKQALQKYGYSADTPLTISGKKKSTGYPDIEFIDEFGRYNYLECKTYNIESTPKSFLDEP